MAGRLARPVKAGMCDIYFRGRAERRVNQGLIHNNGVLMIAPQTVIVVVVLREDGRLVIVNFD